jgi:hypothetical protein
MPEALVWRNQLVNGFQLVKIWLTNVSNTSPFAQAPGVDSSVHSHKATYRYESPDSECESQNV